MEVINRGTVCKLASADETQLFVALDNYNSDSEHRVVLDEYRNVLIVGKNELIFHKNYYNEVDDEIFILNDVTSTLIRLSLALNKSSPY